MDRKNRKILLVQDVSEYRPNPYTEREEKFPPSTSSEICFENSQGTNLQVPGAEEYWNVTNKAYTHTTMEEQNEGWKITQVWGSGAYRHGM